MFWFWLIAMQINLRTDTDISIPRLRVRRRALRKHNILRTRFDAGKQTPRTARLLLTSRSSWRLFRVNLVSLNGWQVIERNVLRAIDFITASLHS